MARGLRPNELVDLLNFGRDSDLSSLSSDEDIVGNFPEKEFEYLLSKNLDYDCDLHILLILMSYLTIMTSMLSFVLKNVPSDWESVSTYNSSYILFDVNLLSREANNVKALFDSTSLNINTIRRVQNPFQYGRFKLRQEMLNSNSVDTVFHIVHADDLETALKYTCDYRRYKNRNNSEGENKHPRFYSNIQNAVSIRSASMMNDSYVLVVNKISGNLKTQSDYYIQYVVDFK